VRGLVVNFPHNPTGYLPSATDFRALVDLARSRDAWLFSDEMYRDLEQSPGDRLPAAVEVG
jgi:aspartate/methionine/tyrosine aminotransferase